MKKMREGEKKEKKKEEEEEEKSTDCQVDVTYLRHQSLYIKLVQSLWRPHKFVAY